MLSEKKRHRFRTTKYMLVLASIMLKLHRCELSDHFYHSTARRAMSLMYVTTDTRSARVTANMFVRATQDVTVMIA